MLLYPLRPSPLLLIFMSSIMIWYATLGLKELLLGIFVISLWILFYAKYLFTILEHTANGYREPPILSYDHLQPFAEIRPYQLLGILLFALSLTLWLRSINLEYIANAVIFVTVCVLPAYTGLLGIHNGFFDSMNPVILLRFISRTGFTYAGMLAVLASGIVALVLLYKSDIGLFIAILINQYSIMLVFHWLGKIIYSKRDELDYRPNISPEREAEKAAEELLHLRKKHLDRVFKERRRENILAILLGHIDREADKLAAHAWYHAEMMKWENKRLALRHSVFYIQSLRGSGKHVIADLIEQECRTIDPEFSSE